MGQQQLLLIALSVLIVGAAVAVGVNMFNEGSAQAEADKYFQRAATIATEFAKWYREPVTMGGGGSDINNWPSDNGPQEEILGIKLTTDDVPSDGIYASAITTGTGEDDPTTGTTTESLDHLDITLSNVAGTVTGNFYALSNGRVIWQTRPGESTSD